jgi:hypothetical protein
LNVPVTREEFRAHDRGPGLSIQFSEGGPQSRMLPENPSTFFITKRDSFIFAREGGQVTSVRLRGDPGSEVVAAKVVAQGQ